MASSRQAPLGIVLKTWNTGESTRACLDAIAVADLRPAEVAVVDLGEDRVTRAHAEAVAARAAISLHWLPIGHRLAPAEANRRAVDQLAAPLIALLDNDVIVPRNWLGPITAILASPNVGLVAPLRPDPFIVYPGRTESTEAVLDEIRGRGGSPAAVANAFTGGLPLDEFGRDVQQANNLQPEVTLEFPSFLSSCCLCFDRQAIDDAGGVADALFDAGYGSEDVDLSWRVLAAGYDLVRTSDVFVLHLRHTSLAANQIDFEAELRLANQLLYGRWRKRLLAWVRERQSRGDTIDDLRQRFIVRELMRNTAFAADLGAAPS